MPVTKLFLEIIVCFHGIFLFLMEMDMNCWIYYTQIIVSMNHQ